MLPSNSPAQNWRKRSRPRPGMLWSTCKAARHAKTLNAPSGATPFFERSASSLIRLSLILLQKSWSPLAAWMYLSLWRRQTGKSALGPQFSMRSFRRTLNGVLVVPLVMVNVVLRADASVENLTEYDDLPLPRSASTLTVETSKSSSSGIRWVGGAFTTARLVPHIRQKVASVLKMLPHSVHSAASCGGGSGGMAATASSMTPCRLPHSASSNAEAAASNGIQSGLFASVPSAFWAPSFQKLHVVWTPILSRYSALSRNQPSSGLYLAAMQSMKKSAGFILGGMSMWRSPLKKCLAWSCRPRNTVRPPFPSSSTLPNFW
mmetsp:Transcript_106188/g.307303  ORF Transcript_106188/g.307303 Transcript_106188/m.307303 type:complete len:319 (+) Transcript_106188:1381-2337(+)